jgi:hypothetical protein
MKKYWLEDYVTSFSKYGEELDQMLHIPVILTPYSGSS